LLPPLPWLFDFTAAGGNLSGGVALLNNQLPSEIPSGLKVAQCFAHCNTNFLTAQVNSLST